MGISEMQIRIAELESKAIQFYQKGEKELAVFFKNASMGLKKRLDKMIVNLE